MLATCGRCVLPLLPSLQQPAPSRHLAASSSINISSFEEGLSRVMYVAGALEHMSLPGSPLSIHVIIPKEPPYVQFFLGYLARQLEVCRNSSCAVEMRSWVPTLFLVTAPRVDAQASESRTSISGWAPVKNRNRELDTWLSAGFSYELSRAEWPWIFEKGDRPALIISRLKALEVLISLKLFFCDIPGRGRTQIQVVPTWTDNRGNGSALNKLMSTRFPSSAVVMELSGYLKRMSAKAVVEWAPRSQNYVTDALANGLTSGFDPACCLFVVVCCCCCFVLLCAVCCVLLVVVTGCPWLFVVVCWCIV